MSRDIFTQTRLFKANCNCTVDVWYSLLLVLWRIYDLTMSWCGKWFMFSLWSQTEGLFTGWAPAWLNGGQLYCMMASTAWVIWPHLGNNGTAQVSVFRG